MQPGLNSFLHVGKQQQLSMGLADRIPRGLLRTVARSVNFRISGVGGDFREFITYSGARASKPSMDSISRRLVKVGARVVYHAKRWYVRVVSAFCIARYYRILFA